MHSGGKVDLEAQIMDSEGRKIQNISSLELDWSLSDSELVTLLRDEKSTGN